MSISGTLLIFCNKPRFLPRCVRCIFPSFKKLFLNFCSDHCHVICRTGGLYLHYCEERGLELSVKIENCSLVEHEHVQTDLQRVCRYQLYLVTIFCAGYVRTQSLSMKIVETDLDGMISRFLHEPGTFKMSQVMITPRWPDFRKRVTHYLVKYKQISWVCVWSHVTSNPEVKYHTSRTRTMKIMCGAEISPATY